MIQPRNTLVVVKLIETPLKQVGAITVPTNNELYTEAEVVAVGPGNVSAEGGRSETHDLKPGQRVFVKHKERRHPSMPPEVTALPYRVGNETFYIFEQSSILAILSGPAALN